MQVSADAAAVFTQTASWPPLLNCGLCRKFAVVPVVCPVQQIFCSSCINNALTVKKQCPVHHRTLRSRDLQLLPDANRMLGQVWNHYKRLLDEATNCSSRKRKATLKLGAAEEEFPGFGGFSRQVKRIKELVSTPLSHPILFRRLGVPPSKCILLHGPPGSGKSLLAECIADQVRGSVFPATGSELMATGNAGQAIEILFKRAMLRAPSLVIIDQLEVVTPASSETISPATGTLMRLIDGLHQLEQPIVVIGIATSPSTIHDALLRHGRFEQRIALGVPVQEDRRRILETSARTMRLDEDVDLSTVAEQLHGFVGADLAAVCAEAGLECLRENQVLDILHGAQGHEAATRLANGGFEELAVAQRHFNAASERIVPSNLRESMAQVPSVTWDAIGGLEDVKQELVELVEVPIRHTSKYAKYGMPPSRGLLLYGPPGCGKTLLAKAVASECQANFLCIKGPELLQRFVGESEAAVRRVFALARASAPCVLFFDEIDALAHVRSRGPSSGGDRICDNVLNQILTELDGVSTDRSRELVFVIGASNRPDMIDPALLRPGRLDSLVLVPLPDESARLDVLRASLRGAPLASDVDLASIAHETEGYSGADLAHVATVACKLALRETLGGQRDGVGEGEGEGEGDDVRQVTAAHLMQALAQSHASVPLNVRLFYDNFKLTHTERRRGLAGGEEEDALTEADVADTAEDAVDNALDDIEMDVSGAVREKLVAITSQWKENQAQKVHELERRLREAEHKLAAAGAL